jgi:hypothetical protein
MSEKFKKPLHSHCKKKLLKLRPGKRGRRIENEVPPPNCTVNSV